MKRTRGGWFKRLFGKADPLAGYGSGWQSLAGPTVPTKTADELWRDYSEAELAEISKASSVVYSCVSAVAGRIPEARVELGEFKSGEWIPDEKHYLNGLLSRPNALMSFGDVLEYLVLNLLTTGEAYLWEPKDAGGFISELWPIPSHLIDPVWTKRTDVPIARYQVDRGRGKEKLSIDACDVTLFRFPDPSSIYHSLAPLAAAARSYQLDEGREDYFIEMLDNLDVPGSVVRSQKRLTPEQRKDLREMLADKVGKGRRGSTLLLSGEGVSYETNAPLKDLDWVGASDVAESRICSCFGVPPIVIGLRVGLNRSTFANYEEAVRSFYRGTLAPLWKRLAEALTRGLILDEPGEENRGLALRFDTSAIPQLLEDATARVDRAIRAFQSGLMTLGEAAIHAGLPAPDDEATAAIRVLPMGVVRIDDEPEADVELPHMPTDDEGSGELAGGDGAAGEGDRSSDEGEEPTEPTEGGAEVTTTEDANDGD